MTERIHAIIQSFMWVVLTDSGDADGFKTIVRSCNFEVVQNK